MKISSASTDMAVAHMLRGTSWVWEIIEDDRTTNRGDRLTMNNIDQGLYPVPWDSLYQLKGSRAGMLTELKERMRRVLDLTPSTKLPANSFMIKKTK